MQDFYEEFGRRLRKFRSNAHLSQSDLASRVRLSRTSITNIELGRQHIALHMLYSLSAAVGVTPERLLPEDDFVSSKSAERNQLPKQFERELAKSSIRDVDHQKWVARIVQKTLVEETGELNERHSDKTR